MKNQLFILTILLTSILFSCNSSKKSEEVANYVYEEKEVILHPQFQREFGDWVKEDLICYGIVVAVDEKGIRKHGKPVKAKILRISSNEIKMKALENVNIAQSNGCAKMGISKGQSWMEKQGDLFKTEEDAINFLKTNGWFVN